MQSFALMSRASLQALHRAIKLDPEFWQYEYDLGRALWKQGAAPQESLHHLAKACCLTQVFVGPRLEPIYRLHAARLKLLSQVSPTLID